MKYNAFLLVLLFALMSFVPNLPKDRNPKSLASNSISKKVEVVFNSLDANNFNLPNLESFTKAFEGFSILKEQGKIKNNYLTIIDFSLSSRFNRLWVIDMKENKIIFNTLVAHGKNSGEDYATKFSNENESLKSSLGFFTTGETYNGKHGLSLKLDGLETGINDHARQRAIVIHGADYVSSSFIKSNNRLGKSHGCPALPVELTKKIIQTIKEKSCLFIYFPSKEYLNNSRLVS
ncbi:murein L,D-transpeptidase catalytic domain family protein [Flavobacterium sp.]|uniref:murein L,D-transpeptidase catalytic domain family protein n=1 Tax=Flavobacterium sp. TaxID=239 RepID=UPI003752BB89